MKKTVLMTLMLLPLSAGAQDAANVGGVAVSIKELDAMAAERLTKVRNEEYQVRRQVLDGLIERRLIEAEARARGVSPTDLERSEISSKVEGVTIEQTRAVYESAPEKYSSMSQEQALGQIKTGLQRTRLAAARKEFFTAARRKHNVKVFLDAPKVAIDTAGAPFKGPATAPVTMIAFSDFQCPYCVRVNPTLKALEAKYPGKLRIAFKDFPLGIHREAQKAAEAGQCAAEQGKFWEMHDKMFANQQKLQPDSLKAFAKEIGLEGPAFGSCLDSGKTAARVAADMALGAKHGVTGTPTFFINGRYLSGAHSIEKSAEIIDDELSRAQERQP